ncbi:cell division protein FtsL [Oleiagrimonas soli]|uniref:Cell division protein FtsL n=1 Tax=Oleiagrimonas soli TaxID=1543381 RepID=A0A099CTZ4_9GAMM|nr:cell division protein FtsL [Oleiagrimonas soli]KGI77062.1 cell division protein FtsL [Oleiagrimonas soli]MBB6185407.1 cell division protein FtsL [Oleiagrimonas soli]
MSIRLVLLLPMLLALVLISAIAVVWARHENRVLFVQLTKLQTQRDALNVEFGRLELEKATWADPSRIETIARGQMGMVNPTAADTRLIRR